MFMLLTSVATCKRRFIKFWEVMDKNYMYLDTLRSIIWLDNKSNIGRSRVKSFLNHISSSCWTRRILRWRKRNCAIKWVSFKSIYGAVLFVKTFWWNHLAPLQDHRLLQVCNTIYGMVLFLKKPSVLDQVSWRYHKIIVLFQECNTIYGAVLSKL